MTKAEVFQAPTPLEHSAMLDRILEGRVPTHSEAMSLSNVRDLKALTKAATNKRDAAHGHVISYSRKVFIPLTKMCRDVCHYCTFAHPPRKEQPVYMSLDEVLETAKQGARAGCKEVLFTLGDKPELRYERARQELAGMGFDSTLAYLRCSSRSRSERNRTAAAFKPRGHDRQRPCRAKASLCLYGNYA